MQIFERPIRLRHERVLLGGIGSVATHASARGKGLASELLRRAIARMRERGMALSLLFTGPLLVLRAARLAADVDAAVQARARRARCARRTTARGCAPSRPDDLARVAALYDAYTEPLSGPTVRDARYWAGQLRTAGTPDEDFRVAERDGEIVAYARAAAFGGRVRVLEYARAADGASALARLLAALTPAEHRLPVPLVRDAELGDALRGARARERAGRGSVADVARARPADSSRASPARPTGTPDRALLESAGRRTARHLLAVRSLLSSRLDARGARTYRGRIVIHRTHSALLLLGLTGAGGVHLVLRG